MGIYQSCGRLGIEIVLFKPGTVVINSSAVFSENMNRRFLKNGLLPFVLIISLLGVRVADVWDFSDYQHVNQLKFESNDLTTGIARETKHKLPVLAGFGLFGFELILPHSHTTQYCTSVQESPSFFVVDTLSARAPPA